jgi:deazaflavin-dependent oxidoreductase (nitroreductase family)
MNAIWKLMMGAWIRVYRLSRGRFASSFGWMGGPMEALLLTTTGRKSGRRRTVFLGYLVDGGRYIVVGANLGLPTDPAWLLNIRAQPRVTIQVRERILEATGSVAAPEDRARLWTELMRVTRGFARYETKTTREIPLVVLTPEQAAPASARLS